MINELKKKGIILQVAVLFLIGIVMIAVLTYWSESFLSDANVKGRMEDKAADTANEIMEAIREYPAYEWLLSYWYENYESMDCEYDVDFSGDTETKDKSIILSQKYPDIPLRYATQEDIESMTSEDQKMYAEVAYSWFITRINQIKSTFGIDYLFGVITEEPYENQFFLFSAADPGAVRGTNYEEVYPLGTQVTVSGSQVLAMKNAQKNLNHLADAGDYLDYYAYFGDVGDHILLIGLTFSLTGINENVTYQTMSGTVTAVIYQLALSLMCLAMLYLFVLRPLKTVQENIRLYKQTKNSEEVKKNLSDIVSYNEIGQLADDVKDLAEEIDHYLSEIEDITAEKERINAELSLASRIQMAMLPSTFPAFPDRKEFSVYASMDPAKEVGGDFYDFFLVDDDHLCFLIADVSGKGVPAALFMMASCIILKNNAMMGKSPGKILEDTNNSICSNNKEEMFVTVWLGILELSTGRLTAANAGHDFPIIKHPGGRFEMEKTVHGFIVGGMKGMKYKEYTVDLEPGSSILLYTDGVPEATDSEGKMYGLDRLVDVLNTYQGNDPGEMLKTVKNSVGDFVKDAEQFDDLTLLGLCLHDLAQGEKD